MDEATEESCSSCLNFYPVSFQVPIIFVVKQLKLDLRKWLSPPDSSINHNISRNVHHKGTARWFFRGEIFKEWRITPSLLWVYGKRTFLHPVTMCLLD